MEIDISTVTGDDIAQVKADATPRAEQQPRSNTNNGNRSDFNNSNLWTDTKIGIKKIEFLKYTYDKEAFSFFFNDRTNNVPQKQIEKLRAIFKVLVETKKWKMRVCYKNDKMSSDLTTFTTEQDKIEWYLPFKKYNPEKADNAISTGNNKSSFELVKGTTKFYDKIPPFVRALNACQIEVLLGKDLDKALGCVFIYTPCGTESIGRDFDYGTNGNVAFVIRMAKELKIPLFNISSPTFVERFNIFLKEGKYYSATAYKVRNGGNDHNEGAPAKEDINTVSQQEQPVEEKKENTETVVEQPSTQSVEVTEDPTADLFA